MTDPGAEMKARAQKVYVDWVDDDDDGRSYWEVAAAFAAKEVARAVEDERMANCKAICRYCRDPKLWLPAVDHPELSRYVHHGIGVYRIADCQAAQIHERFQVKGEGL